MKTYEVRGIYFNWLASYVEKDYGESEHSFSRLIALLDDIPFHAAPAFQRDENRAADGVSLRYRFAITQMPEEDPDEVLFYLARPCSVLEMMIALAIRCEETITDDPNVGDRTSFWFWRMISSLGLSGMTNRRFNERLVLETIERFMDRDYEPNGVGGLFTIHDTDVDLRTVEIWYQLCWYLDRYFM